MKYRKFGNTNKMVSEIGLGTWQLGTKWGDPFNEEEGLRILDAANKEGITFIDTADVYNNGDSERTIGKYIKSHRNEFFITTKCGRKLNPHTASMYTPEAIEKYIDESRERLGVETLDLVLLHCPPTEVYKKKEIFDKLEELKKFGKISSYGVSIEKVEEGLMAMEYGISAIEVIFNMFRLKPLEELLPKAKEKNIGIIVRVPLASGLLTGKYTKDTKFGENDHRTFNRDGKAFDKGETFSGVDYDLGLKAVEELKKVFKTDDLVPYALKWILMHDEVSVVIPGASRVEQVYSNNRVEDFPDLTENEMKAVLDIYNKYIRESVHNNW
ncbi:MAG: aldo/keto reductase [Bacilli bacterium]|nr:aldo/keto reductase [Bacilli bacterium]